MSALPKVALSRATGLLTRLPLPRRLRAPTYRWFARRYGARLEDVAGTLEEYPSLAAFFKRPLVAGARPIATDAPLVWPCDGRIVASGPILGERLEQVKGRTYGLAQLIGDADFSAALAGGSQATIYLAPRDYHRVHAPFAGTLGTVRRLPGKLFPVNPPTVDSIEGLFATNERVVFEFRLDAGVRAAVIMVAALNVGDIEPVAKPGSRLTLGAELGRFGFGSTTVVTIGPGGPTLPNLPRETAVRMGTAIPQA